MSTIKSHDIGTLIGHLNVNLSVDVNGHPIIQLVELRSDAETTISAVVYLSADEAHTLGSKLMDLAFDAEHLTHDAPQTLDAVVADLKSQFQAIKQGIDEAFNMALSIGKGELVVDSQGHVVKSESTGASSAATRRESLFPKGWEFAEGGVDEGDSAQEKARDEQRAEEQTDRTLRRQVYDKMWNEDGTPKPELTPAGEENQPLTGEHSLEINSETKTPKTLKLGDTMRVVDIVRAEDLDDASPGDQVERN